MFNSKDNKEIGIINKTHLLLECLDLVDLQKSHLCTPAEVSLVMLLDLFHKDNDVLHISSIVMKEVHEQLNCAFFKPVKQ